MDFPKRMRTRYIREIGVKTSLRIYWESVTVKEGGGFDYGKDCPNSMGGGHQGVHNAWKLLGMAPLGDWEAFGKPEDHPAEEWPTHCTDCGAPVPSETPERPLLTTWSGMQLGSKGVYLVRQVFHERGYDTPSGEPEPGDIFWRECVYRGEGKDKCYLWDNCPGQHLIAVLPNAHQWDIDGRCSNCGEGDDTPEKREAWKKEKTHRCWVKHGDPAKGENVTVDKSGHTCPAGGGSIAVPGYHGHLRDGVFDP